MPDMLEIHSLTAVLATEALVALLLALIFMLFRATSRKKVERSQAIALVDRINGTDAQRLDQLGTTLADPALKLDDAQRQHALEELSSREKALYRLVIQAFLDRDTERLAQLDEHVRALSEPFRDLMKGLTEKLPQQELGVLQTRLEAAEQEAQQALGEVERLGDQLRTALETLTEVSSEYARMFGEPKSSDEIQLSRQRMLAAFHRAETGMRADSPDRN